ncbi:MAG TPA: flagellar motor protein MotB [Nannocystaceae bacterium]|nr:flagellar motor protein MotB [Nannocystaceae bacterium]
MAAKEREPHRPPQPPPKSSAGTAWFLALLFCAGCVGGGWYYWELFQAHEVQAATLSGAHETASACTKKLEPALARAESCESERAAEGKQLEELGKTTATLKTDLQASEGELTRLRELEAAAAKRGQAFEELKEQLKEMIASKQLDVQRKDGRLVVQLPAEVLFPSGSAELSEDGKIALIKLSAVLERMPDRKFMVAGHTDGLAPMKGSKFRDNWELSTARAVTVTELLVTAKIDPKNLVAAGYGEFAPIAGNGDERGRKQNRRIEIVLLPNIDELTVLDDPGEKKIP